MTVTGRKFNSTSEKLQLFYCELLHLELLSNKVSSVSFFSETTYNTLCTFTVALCPGSFSSY